MSMLSKLQPTEQELRRYRPIPFYFITTTDTAALSYEAARRSLNRLKEDGFGGIVLFNKPPHGFTARDYLGEDWFRMVKNFVMAAADLELTVWINDGFDFPPGGAGGRISRTKYPHLTQKRLVLSEGRVVEQEVEWGFPAFEEPESAQLFHEIVYEAYLREVGEYFGGVIRGFFSDADNRRVNADVFREDSLQRDYFPWSSGFADSFQQRFGYDIRPYLELVLKKVPCPQAADYWCHAGNLYQSWFASNYQWCRDHGLEYTFHTSDSAPFTMEEAPRSSLYTEGRALDMEKNCDYPGTDQELLELNGGKHLRKEEYWVPKASWGGDDSQIRNPQYRNLYSDLRAKQAGSAAFLYHKKGAMCEMFAATNWGATPTDLREIAAWQIMQGITFIVPHAYHHRLLGETKYFAPPDFSPHSHLAPSVRKLNDTLAQYCYYASLGILKAPIALLDLTDDIWEGYTDNRTLFSLCLELNRLPYGYVLADPKAIAANREAFSVIINAGPPLQGERKRLLSSLGIPVIGPQELERLPDLVHCPVSYEGEGTPHFMRRRLEDGSDLVILANIEDGRPIKGVLRWEDASFPVALQSGELAFYTREGQLSADRTPDYLPGGIPLPEWSEVLWERENLLPLEWWLDQEDRTVLKQGKEELIYFPYHVEDGEVRQLKLLVSMRSFRRIMGIYLDGHPLSGPEEVKVFDDAYLSYRLEAGMSQGEHVLAIRKSAPLPEKDRILLQGEFGVELQAQEPFFLLSDRQYSLDRYIPRQAQVKLSKRPYVLNTAQSWSEQGHPFYSGGVTYRMELSFSQNFGSGVLRLPLVRDVCGVRVDGRAVGGRIFAPYVFELGDMGGEHQLEVTVYNTLGNAMEFYRAPSGLLAGGVVHHGPEYREDPAAFV